jgi:hypothetical protein
MVFKTGIYIAEVDENGDLKLSHEVKEKLELKSGDKVEVSIKKVVAKRDLINKSENPLYELTRK